MIYKFQLLKIYDLLLATQYNSNTDLGEKHYTLNIPFPKTKSLFTDKKVTRYILYLLKYSV